MSGMTSAKDALCLKFNLLVGAGANTNIAVTGIVTTDEIVFAGVFATAAAIATFADDTANCTITSDGNIQSATDTTSNQIFLVWLDTSA
jgi:hypothetical protein